MMTAKHPSIFSKIINILRPAPQYYVDDIVKRDSVLNDIYQQMENGKSWLNAIHTPSAAQHGERIAEYAYIASLLKKNTLSSILDVGCVLNNPIIKEHISKQTHLSFLNPAQEKVIYADYDYFKQTLAESRIDKTFSLVTCLSTLEHIGFDNTRYGTKDYDKGWDWDRAIQEIITSIDKLLTLTSENGTLVVSCPYGCKEHVLLPPQTGVRTAQVLHNDHVAALTNRFESQIEIVILRLTDSGWIKTSPDDSFQPYGSIGPGASGLILMIGRK